MNNDSTPLQSDNIISAIARVSVRSSISKTGKPYTVATVHLLNGYSFDAFLDANQQQAVRDSLNRGQQGSHFDLTNDQPTQPVVDG